MNQPGFIGVMLLIALGTFGLGRGLLTVLDHLGAPERRVAISGEVAPPVVLTIGVAVFLVVGGVGVAFEVATFPVLAAILLVGVAITVVRFVERVRSSGLTMPRARTTVVTAAFGFVAFIAYGAALSGPINPNDDDPGYLYLGYRLLVTGGLIDPFNLRRITSYGGGELFQALVIHTSGSAATLGVEWFFFVLLVLALVLGRTSRPFAAPVVVVLGLGLSVAHPVGIWANSAPTFSGVALTIAIFQLVATSSRGTWNWRHDVCIGLLVAGLLALRFQFAVPVAAVIILSALSSRKRSAWKPLLTAGAVGVCSIVGWAVALQRSSGTVLFPLFAGNFNSEFPWADPSVTSLRQFISRAWSQIDADAWGFEMLALIAAIVVTILVGRRWNGPDQTSPVVTVTAAGVLGCSVLLLSETRSLSGSAAADIARYNAPSALALSCFVVGAIWSAVEGGDRVHSNEAAKDTTHDSWDRRLRTAVSSAMAVALLAIPVGGAFASIPRSVAQSGTTANVVTRATYNDALYAANRLTGRYGSTDRLAAMVPVYARINAVIAPGSHLLAAVTHPGLLDFSRFDFATLDIAGAVSPSPGIPLTEGGAAVLSYLRALGYNGIVASVTNAPGLYNYKSWKAHLDSGIEDYRAMATQFTAWARVLTSLNHNPEVQRVRIDSLIYLSWSVPKGAT